MERRHIKWIPLVLAGLFFAYQYFSSEKFVNPETGRKSHVAMSTREEGLLGLQSYQQVLAQSETVDGGPELEMIKRVASRLARATGKAGADFDWQVSLIRSSQVNAFCLPGGKIVVYNGILPVTQNEPSLATVLGHEMAHATSRHGSQRVLQQNLAQTALTGVAMSLSDMDYDKQRAIMGALGAGAQFGVLMPFSRQHESEADATGLHYMARAGYDPRESIGFWQRMERAGGAQPPEFLSSHPSHGTRIEQLQAEIPRALEEYNRSPAADTQSSR
ncbi:MAG: peptidase M48 family protein [Verrucomicrobia bacterium]|nr:MAG: peptidase M48 family protein [Verrucomicrobiota bacterium]PYL50085.1 MAG: peptidase M48 family protein [Verrucomicrobiota bacterium]